CLSTNGSHSSGHTKFVMRSRSAKGICKPWKQQTRGVIVTGLTFRGCLIILTFATFIYAQNATRPEFEVASVRLSDPGNVQVSYMPTLDVRPGGTLRISNRRLDEIIMVAFGVGGKQIVGPRWLTELTTDPTQVTRYEIIAKVPENATKDQVAL